MWGNGDGSVPTTGVTFGVEEEFHILDPGTGRLAPASPALLADGSGADKEFHARMIETATPVCTGLRDLRAALVAARGRLVAAADRAGVCVVASGTVPDSGSSDAPVCPDDRFRRISDRYRRLAAEQHVCATQVQVGVADPDLAVRLIARIRGWLPVLLALSASSPFFGNADTGYASYRNVVASRWPTAGPAPVAADHAAYQRSVRTLIDTGVIDDPGMIYHDVRVSHRYPTLEIRICDSTPVVDDVVLIAALSRALVATSAAEDQDDVPGTPMPDELVRAATWVAARDGLRAGLISPATHRLIPAADVVAELVAHVTPALARAGDAEAVTTSLAALLRSGNSVQRQHRVLTAGSGLVGVVAALAAETRSELGPAVDAVGGAGVRTSPV
ncbi:glutamate--cysteine ligase [Longispora sp. K20-0274]|uniref:carboxylate-amine ligase n=1 Tax=Longispora sp. K20-0274 TaxID=3088255 RepID=UPI00399AE796